MSSNDCLSVVAAKNNFHKCPYLGHSFGPAIWFLEMDLYISNFFFYFKETFLFPYLYLPTSPHTSTTHTANASIPFSLTQGKAVAVINFWQR